MAGGCKSRKEKRKKISGEEEGVFKSTALDPKWEDFCKDLIKTVMNHPGKRTREYDSIFRALIENGKKK